MKKIFTLFFLALILSNILFAGDRMVIVERFTSSTCPPCASNNPIMDAFLHSLDPDKIIGISYHMNWPPPGNDPMYAYNPVDNNARRSFYNINAIPQAQMDGLINIQSPYNNGTLTGMFNSRTNILSPITIIVTDSTWGDSVLIRARIYTEVMLANPNVTVQFAIREDSISNINPPPTNGESLFPDVMRRMPLNGSGEVVTMFPGQTYIIERKYRKDVIWNFGRVSHIVFLQQGQEILGVGAKTRNFTLIPTTSYKSVQQGQSQSATFQMSIPVTVAGYNSPVNLTYEVDPPNAGITVSFPNGSTISSFPASFNVQVNSTASVPLGAYRIIVTGTNTNNKVHKTSVSYLVGRNFISVAANRPQLQFRVDNQNYTNVSLFNWDLNSSHTLTAISPQTFGSTRYVFQNWSNNGDSSHTITVGTNTTSYIVNYKTQFRLIANVSPGGIAANVVGGNLFYDSSTTIGISVSPMQVQFNGQTWYFNRWNGVGNGSYTGTNPTPQLTMNNVIVQTAIFDTIAPFGIQNLGLGVPKSYEMHQNYPNPFNPVTKIKFDIPRFSEVSIKIYDLLGAEVATVYSGELQAGFYEADVDASGYASGVYFYRIEAGDYINVKRMILVK